MKVILGKKIEMTQVFQEDGTVVPVTLIEAGPCIVTAVRGTEDKKTAVLGFGHKKNVAKPQREEWRELGQFAFVKEVQIDEALERGAKVEVDRFVVGDLVNVTGTSKGKGFQGVVKRHGFHGSPATHGHKDQLRMSGSIGAGGPQRVFKGVRMGGRMGGEQITVKNLEVIKVDSKQNIIAVKGAIPGCRGSFVSIAVTDGNIWQK